MPLQLMPSTDIETLVELLRDAEEGGDRIRAALNHPHSAGYIAFVDADSIGAALMHWDADESELVYIAVQKAHQGKGYGKTIIAHLLDEARQRGVKSVFVGTANASLENIAFYQKCGFRMDHIRKDFFNYFPQPIYENGILIQDMIVLRYTLI